jgi:hypothetical protein
MDVHAIVDVVSEMTRTNPMTRASPTRTLFNVNAFESRDPITDKGR